MRRKVVQYKRASTKESQQVGNNKQLKFIQNLQNNNADKIIDQNNNQRERKNKEKKSKQQVFNSNGMIFQDDSDNEERNKRKNKHYFDIPAQYKDKNQTQKLRLNIVKAFLQKQPILNYQNIMQNFKYQKMMGQKVPSNYIQQKLKKKQAQNYNMQQSPIKKQERKYAPYLREYPKYNERYYQEQDRQQINIDQQYVLNQNENSKKVNYLDYLCQYNGNDDSEQQISYKLKTDNDYFEDEYGNVYKNDKNYLTNYQIPIIQNDSQSQDQVYNDRKNYYYERRRNY